MRSRGQRLPFSPIPCILRRVEETSGVLVHHLKVRRKEQRVVYVKLVEAAFDCLEGASLFLHKYRVIREKPDRSIVHGFISVGVFLSVCCPSLCD